uniref:3-ketoacyl-CoA synthase 1 n=1 Tax=Anthurium amnicola TaxID=1678845 RepID=A0A1D1XDV1_9ARAE
MSLLTPIHAAILNSSAMGAMAESQVGALVCRHWVTLLALVWCAAVAVVAGIARRPLPVHLLDYSCYKPDGDRKCSYEASEYFVRRSGRYNTTSEEFMRAIYLKSGLGDETYGPPFLFRAAGDATLASARQESEEGMFAAVDALLGKTRVGASEIDVVAVACSMFTPCPSLTAVLVQRYGCRPDVKTYSLSGMGCSAGNIAIDMAERILRRKPGYYY